MKLDDLTKNDNAGIVDVRDTLVEIANNISKNIKGHWSVESDPRALDPLCAYTITSQSSRELCRFYPLIEADGNLYVSISTDKSHLKCRYEKNLISSMYDFIIRNISKG